MPDTPFFLRMNNYIGTAVRTANEQKLRANIRSFETKQTFKPKKKKGGAGILGDAIRNAAGFVPNMASETKDILDGPTSGIMKGLEKYGNQVAAGPAFLTTKGKVQDGQYTTQRNLLGNPISNIQSHLKAQAQTGNPIKPGSITSAIAAT